MRMALVAGLLLLACRREEIAREPVMRDTLAQMRSAMAKYRHDNGHGPSSLDELVPKYLRQVPADPVTGQNTRRVTTEERVTPSGDFSATAAPRSKPEIVGINSGAPGTDSSGKRWSDY